MVSHFKTPNQMVFGINSLKEVASSFLIYGRKAFVISDPTMQSMGYVSQLLEHLHQIELPYSIFLGIRNEPTIEDIHLAATQYQLNQCDMLIALGGGSVLDAMKAVAIKVSTDHELLDCVEHSFESIRPPMIAIPTTAGTGSEATQFTIITDTVTQQKCLIKGSSLLPDLAILDATFTLNTPYLIRVSCGIDALCHAIEAYLSKKTQPMSQMYALQAIKGLMTHLPLVLTSPNNIYSCEVCLMSSYQAGCAFSNSSVTLLHGLSRPIGANFKIPHGLSNALLLETCMHFYELHCCRQIAQLARDLGWTKSQNDRIAARVCSNRILQLLHNLDLPKISTLIPEELWTEEQCFKMADDALRSGSPGNTPCEVNIDMLVAIYKTVYNN